jgi:hypothetical protein
LNYMNENRLLLVGDNPFIGVSHLSQERAVARGNDLNDPAFCAMLLKTALNNGADGFMFTVNEKTLAIVKNTNKEAAYRRQLLYAIVPYVPEFVRIAASSGGIPGLATKIGKQILFSGNVAAAFYAGWGAAGNNPGSLIKSYLSYELSRLKAASGPGSTIASVMFHEVVTDMALALNMRWLFEAHISYMRRHNIKPGFETRNFAYFVKKCEEWKLDISDISIATPFNSIGFQMCPSKEVCEKTLARIPKTEVIAFSILAAGYVKLPEAAAYIEATPALKGVAIGVSKEKQANETFAQIKAKLTKNKQV